MTDGPFLVTGASGNVGRAVVAALEAAGAEVRAPGHTGAARLDFEDPATFGPSVKGCRGLFLLRPPAIARVGPTLNRLVDVAAQHGIEHCVFLSVAGADRNPVVPHHRVERHLKGGPLAWTILRPGFFAQNLTGPYVADIRAGRLYVPARDGRVAFVDARDLGDVAALALRNAAEHAGRAYHLTGPRAVTFTEVAALLTETLGRPVRYEPASVLGYARHLRATGLPAAQIAVQTVLHVGLRRGQAAAVVPTLGQLLGRPARPIERFILDAADTWR